VPTTSLRAGIETISPSRRTQADFDWNSSNSVIAHRAPAAVRSRIQSPSLISQVTIEPASGLPWNSEAVIASVSRKSMLSRVSRRHTRHARVAIGHPFQSISGRLIAITAGFELNAINSESVGSVSGPRNETTCVGSGLTLPEFVFAAPSPISVSGCTISRMARISLRGVCCNSRSISSRNLWFSLIVGPVFYFAHEAAWNYYGPSGRRNVGRGGDSVTLTVLPLLRRNAKGAQYGRARVTIGRALAKTITFRTIASTMEFTANYVVAGDLATAALLSSFGLVAGPFVYLGHEKLWEVYGSRGEAAPALPAPRHVASAPV
jgi:uncharacterized membrane protein